ncbi:hypothetical protein GGR56DRAFT_676726 [Xylariaceae sp. FL0804]|nr:hypothetical protein GGR56DRAFT_676726 [Xylariaceae sp. FL0804]
MAQTQEPQGALALFSHLQGLIIFLIAALLAGVKCIEPDGHPADQGANRGPPGGTIFGNLVHLGENHARVAHEWTRNVASTKRGGGASEYRHLNALVKETLCFWSVIPNLPTARQSRENWVFDLERDLSDRSSGSRMRIGSHLANREERTTNP